jgi:hypothetical protein
MSNEVFRDANEPEGATIVADESIMPAFTPKARRSPSHAEKIVTKYESGDPKALKRINKRYADLQRVQVFKDTLEEENKDGKRQARSLAEQGRQKPIVPRAPIHWPATQINNAFRVHDDSDLATLLDRHYWSRSYTTTGASIFVGCMLDLTDANGELRGIRLRVEAIAPSEVPDQTQIVMSVVE